MASKLRTDTIQTELVVGKLISNHIKNPCSREQGFFGRGWQWKFELLSVNKAYPYPPMSGQHSTYDHGNNRAIFTDRFAQGGIRLENVLLGF